MGSGPCSPAVMQPIPWSLPWSALLGLFHPHASPDRVRGNAAEGGNEERRPNQVLATARSAERERMVRLIVERGVADPRLTEALLKVARHEFVPHALQTEAYSDRALPIGEGQTISQPYIVALMTRALDLTPRSNVLEIGTGSAYQTAILCELALHVTTIEVRPELSRSACRLLAQLGYANVECRSGDGSSGAPDRAPFDAIIVTAAPERIPPALIDQLAVGGRMCIPVGGSPAEQHLLRIQKRSDGTITREVLAPVRFVPMIGTP
jgi:protein-L-isoaspartate(D-aspartate) O-methyltransferase